MSSGTQEAIQFVVEELKLHPNTYIVSNNYTHVLGFFQENSGDGDSLFRHTIQLKG